MSENLVQTNPKLHLTQRINGVMQEVAYIQRDKKVVPGMGYRPVSHQVVIGEIRPILIKWGITIVPSECLKSETIQYMSDKGKPMFLTTLVQGYRVMNSDNANDGFTCSILALGSDSADKGSNKALTMTEKQLFLKLFHIEVGDEAESAFDNDLPSAEKITKISAAQVSELAELGKRINLAPEIVARVVGFEKLSDVPVAEYQGLVDRLNARYAQLNPPKTENGAAA